MREPLLSKESVNRIKKNFILLSLILLIPPVFITFHSLFFLRDLSLFIKGMVLSLIIYLLGVISFILGYLREPAKITEITGEGFTYLPVMGRKRTILWENVKSFKERPDIKTMYIIYKGRLGMSSISFRTDVGRELRKEWDEWKKKQYQAMNNNGYEKYGLRRHNT